MQQCASDVVEVIPLIMRFLRGEMRRQRGAILSVPQLRALAFLSYHPGTSLNALADHLGVTPSTASAITDRLVQHGLVERAVHPQERRRIRLTLTPTGSQLLRQARAVAQSRVADVLARLPADQLYKVAAGIVLLGDAFKREASENSQDSCNEQD